jgi:hypothetical protein
MPNSASTIKLPKSWPAKVCAAMLHVVSLTKYAAVYTRSWAADSRSTRVRLRAEKDQILQEAKLLREEMRIREFKPGVVLTTLDATESLICLRFLDPQPHSLHRAHK